MQDEGYPGKCFFIYPGSTTRNTDAKGVACNENYQ